jgi:hypothetical protein
VQSRHRQKAFKEEFYDVSASIQNPHLMLKDFETKPNNNILERLNGTFRERTKVFRSLDTPSVPRSLRQECRPTITTSGPIRELRG